MEHMRNRIMTNRINVPHHQSLVMKIQIQIQIQVLMQEFSNLIRKM